MPPKSICNIAYLFLPCNLIRIRNIMKNIEVNRKEKKEATLALISVVLLIIGLFLIFSL